MTSFDPDKVLEALAKFFDLSQRALLLIFSVMIVAFVTLVIDLSDRITSLPRGALAVFYLFGLLCFVYLISAVGLHTWRRYQQHAEQVAQTYEADRQALANLAAIGPLHKACLVYLKQSNQKRWQDEDWNTLLAMGGSNFLTWSQAGQSVYWYEVRDVVWNSPQLQQWAASTPKIPAPPWHPENLLAYSR